ncbi:MAG: pimeloyl-ACP methyl ester carboxylesterase [Zhongshania sp.]|jgi:pimeloyl-ACP methyl ester carboxylesterase
MNTEHHLDFGRGPASWLERQTCSDTLHFSAANGFPIASYNFFLKYFHNDFSILGLENRGAWGAQLPPRGFTWRQHADDLIAFLDYRRKTQHKCPVIAMGHSIGATVSALAAVKRPDLFKALLMIDPAAIPGRILPAVATITPTRLRSQLKLVKSTRRRKSVWESRAAFIDYHRGKSAYRCFSDAAITDYAQAGLVEQTDSSFKLRYSREWEAHNFQHVYSPWQALRHMTVPTLVLRAEHSYLHKQHDFTRNMARVSPLVSHGVITGAGHMALQEDCEQVVEKSYTWLRENQLFNTLV